MSATIRGDAGARGTEQAAPDTGLVAFTWNLGGSSDALDLACRHLATQGPFVAALQELPAEAGTRLTLAAGEHRLKVLSRGLLRWDEKQVMHTVNPRIVLLASDGIEVDWLGNAHEYKPHLDDQRRLEGLTLRAESWPKSVQVLGVHAWDRKSRPKKKKRREWASIMSNVLRDFWEDGPLIVMGDLNAHPWSAEVTARSGLYAVRRKDWPHEGSGKLSGRDAHVRPLYNPMWQLLADGSPSGHGTLFYPNDRDLRWHCFDQIIVSEQLREHLGTPTVLTKIGDYLLVDEDGVPKKQRGTRKPALSDHLPVQITMDVGKV